MPMGFWFAKNEFPAHLGGTHSYLHPTPNDVHVLPAESDSLPPTETGPCQEPDQSPCGVLTQFAGLR